MAADQQILLTPHAQHHPLMISQSQYDVLVRRTEDGWSACKTVEEFLAKLHYLKEGFIAGKLEEASFLEREQRLVIQWWKGSR